MYHSLHTQIIDSLKKGKSFPPSMLILGPSLSGKKSLALEIARLILGIEEEIFYKEADAKLLIAGKGTLKRDIFVNLQILSEGKGLKELKHHTIFLLQIYLKLFDEVLWQEDDNPKRKGSKIEKILEKYTELMSELKEKDTLKDKFYKDFMKNIEELESCLPDNQLLVNNLRPLYNWSTQLQGPKVVIINQAQILSVNAQNALLKILEEPPHAMHFILIARQRGNILDTIMSRVQIKKILPYTEEKESSLIQFLYPQIPIKNLKYLFLYYMDPVLKALDPHIIQEYLKNKMLEHYNALGHSLNFPKDLDPEIFAEEFLKEKSLALKEKVLSYEEILELEQQLLVLERGIRLGENYNYTKEQIVQHYYYFLKEKD